MKIRVGILLLTFFGLLAWAYSASASDDLFKRAAGHYEGTLTSFERGQYTRLVIKADLAGDKEGMKSIIIKSEEDTQLLGFELSKIGKKDFIIGGPFVDGQIKLVKDEKDDCFTELTNHIDFCFYRDLVTIEVTSKSAEYAISLNRFAHATPPPLEEPKVYDLQTALNLAWKFNFDNRIEFEHVIQAKQGQIAAKHALLPRISFTTIVNNVKPTVLSVIGAAGDLLPFLFPTRWLQAKHAAIMSQAEQDAMTLMRLDTATQVEAQFYALENYRQLYNRSVEAIPRAERLLEIVKDKEFKLGSVKKGTSLTFLTGVDEMKDDKIWLTDEYGAQKGMIAQVMGFYNPAAVKDAVIGEEFLPINRAQPLVDKDVAKIAIDRSIELKQLGFLKDAAANAKKQVLWNWLDPQGDPSLGLGWALKSVVNVADSMFYESELLINNKKAQLESQAYAAVHDYNAALEDFPIVSELENAQVTLLDLYAQKLKFTGKEKPDEALALLVTYINEEVRLQNDLMVFRTARARVDRLLLQGFYAKATLSPKIDRDPKK